MLAILGAYLFDDFKKDKGFHTKAKVLHTLFLILMIVSYSDMFLHLGRLLRKYEETQRLWSETIGYIPGEVNFIITFIRVFTAIVLLHYCFQMARRKEHGKRWVLRLLPILCVTEIISFYGGWIEGASGNLDHWIGLMIGFILLGGICTLVIITYSKDFMIDFYERRDFQHEAIENFGKNINETNE